MIDGDSAELEKAGITTQAAARLRMTAEHRFFLTTSIALFLVCAIGFGFNAAMGRSSFASPWFFHVHAFMFFGWLVLYALQNALVTTGSVALHKRLGWLAVGWAPSMVVFGISMAVWSVRNHGGPAFFDEREFLIGNSLVILTFAGLTATAIRLRRRTAWHRRLMFCGTAVLTGNAFGRLMPMPLLVPWAWWIVSFALPMIFPLLGVANDRRLTGRVHVAWWWGIGTIIVMMLATDLIAYSPVGSEITRRVAAGTEGAKRGFSPYHRKPVAAPPQSKL